MTRTYAGVPQPEVASFDSYDVSGVAEKIKSGEAKKIVVMVGAGISCNAGIPDFRTPGTGLYDNLQAYNLPYPEAVFDLSFFASNPEPFYRLCKELWPGNYKPTITHRFLSLLHKKGVLMRCFTQNIDSLESQAGLPIEKLVAAHGNFDSARCISTGKPVPIDEVKEAVNATKGWEILRKKYGGLVKPDIVFFGEQLPDRFFSCAATDFPECDMLIVIGTSLVVQPFASLIGYPPATACRVLINMDRAGEANSAGWQGFTQGFEFTGKGRDVFLQGDCDKVVTALVRELGWEEEL
eukprot:CAMPEP_0170191784 /NCGR_PEP_ID=MMETSP0040_2-20121228/52507_1 /TAXON_ID=641309 /ORGANISM="Lotharella oceanica, Strain CCMP622" /LENGTH=294 /DNA_ID=CAMNT_0010439939 /DNA_START=194 /DNA_END=1078 /DNA_ORIENTATION=-